MSEFPAIPLWTDAYLADTRHLSAQEHGAYLLLLMMAWRMPDCALPDDDGKLARWAAVDPRTWRRIKATVMAFWTASNGIWLQKRLTKEREFVSKRAVVSRQNGGHGRRPKSLKNNDATNPMGSVQDTREKPTYTHTHKEREDPAPPPDGGVARPPIPKPAKSSVSSGNGGSLKPARATTAVDRVDDAVKRAEAEQVLADPLASDEDRFWALQYRLADKGIALNRAIQLANEHLGDGYGPVVAALEKTLKARNPSSYLGGVLRERKALAKAEAGEEGPSPKNGRKSKFPPAIQDWFDEGYHVEPDGPGKWIVAGVIRNDAGDEIGW